MEYRARTLNGEDIYHSIKDDILTFKLLPGALISENELAKKYNVSRTPVKSAFLRLMSEQFIEIAPQRGTYVTKLDLGRIRDIIFMRTTLEREIFYYATDHLNEEIVESLQDNLTLQAKLVEQREFDPQLFYKLDSDFHKALFEHAGRIKLWEIIQEFQVYYTRFRMLDIIATSAFDQLVKEHEALLKLLIAHDKEALATLLHDHLHGNLIRLAPRIDTEFAEYFVPSGYNNLGG